MARKSGHPTPSLEFEEGREELRRTVRIPHPSLHPLLRFGLRALPAKALSWATPPTWLCLSIHLLHITCKTTSGPKQPSPRDPAWAEQPRHQLSPHPLIPALQTTVSPGCLCPVSNPSPPHLPGDPSWAPHPGPAPQPNCT